MFVDGFEKVGKKQGSKHEMVMYHADWCAPCKAHKSIFLSAAKSHDIPARLVNVDEDMDEVHRNVRAIPHVDFLENGTVKDSYVGNHPAKNVDSFIVKAKVKGTEFKKSAFSNMAAVGARGGMRSLAKPDRVNPISAEDTLGAAHAMPFSKSIGKFGKKPRGALVSLSRVKT